MTHVDRGGRHERRIVDLDRSVQLNVFRHAGWPVRNIVRHSPYTLVMAPTKKAALELMQEALEAQAELEKESARQSDRGIIILSATMLEAAVGALLRSNLLADSHGLLSSELRGITFSQCIELSYGMGLISKDERRDLNTIRHIRNQIAHSITGGGFSTDSIKDRCLNLTLGERLYAPAEVPLVALPNGKRGIPADLGPDVELPTIDMALPSARDPRARFIATVRVLLRILAARQAARIGIRVESPSEFEFPEDVDAIGAAAIRRGLKELSELRARLGQESSREELGEGIPAKDSSDYAYFVILAMADYYAEVFRRSRALSEKSPAPAPSDVHPAPTTAKTYPSSMMGDLEEGCPVEGLDRETGGAVRGRVAAWTSADDNDVPVTVEGSDSDTPVWADRRTLRPSDS